MSSRRLFALSLRGVARRVQKLMAGAVTRRNSLTAAGAWVCVTSSSSRPTPWPSHGGHVQSNPSPSLPQTILDEQPEVRLTLSQQNSPIVYPRQPSVPIRWATDVNLKYNACPSTACLSPGVPEDERRVAADHLGISASGHLFTLLVHWAVHAFGTDASSRGRNHGRKARWTTLWMEVAAATLMHRPRCVSRPPPKPRSSGRRYAATGLTVAAIYSPFASAGTGKPRLRMRAAMPGSRPRNFL